ncbi:MAG: phospholipase A [Pseudomonadota bacterium]
MKKCLKLALFALLFPASAPLAADKSDVESAIDRRQELEWKSRDNPFAIIPHRPSYILPLTYIDKTNPEPYEGVDEDLVPSNNEVKYQFSFKVPLAKGLLYSNGYLSFGYTQQSFWQAYSSHSSSPFRETNYEPELLFTLPLEERALGFNWRLAVLSLNHQSNGRTDPLSRSWNRVMLELVAEKNSLYLSLKPWWRVPEEEGDDDNPDIEEYLGNFELRLLKKHDNHTFGLMLRNNLDTDNNHGAGQFNYTFPINERLKGYAQFFSGYGESLIDYDHYNNRIGVGIMLTDWL